MRAVVTMNNAAKRALMSQQSKMLRAHNYVPYLYAMRHIDVKVVSPKENVQMNANVAAQRPTSPHFGIYKWPLAGLASGTQRATGFALILGWTTAGLLSLPGLPVTVLPAFIEGIKAVPVLHALVKTGVAFSFGFHGTKNTIMTRLPRLDVESVHKAAAYAMIGGFTCTGIALFFI
eukprot:CAMPEP_0197029814 /NCGR_PEP_ID=MMETSP1384-20130603/9184_1 /TAXON_ID=29189 /ORGANISM="Ammonia sp." /LENGTH=175 /DNA_ID=CAMNT_0042459051 /DNA_START=41 /DNA_END=568 /DNA_ORIENTATION=+